jgi:hypothetical protein
MDSNDPNLVNLREVLGARLDRHLDLLEKQTVLIEQLQDAVSVLRVQVQQLQNATRPPLTSCTGAQVDVHFVDGRVERMPFLPPSQPLC